MTSQSRSAPRTRNLAEPGSDPAARVEPSVLLATPAGYESHGSGVDRGAGGAASGDY